MAAKAISSRSFPSHATVHSTPVERGRAQKAGEHRSAFERLLLGLQASLGTAREWHPSRTELNGGKTIVYRAVQRQRFRVCLGDDSGGSAPPSTAREVEGSLQSLWRLTFACQSRKRGTFLEVLTRSEASTAFSHKWVRVPFLEALRFPPPPPSC